MRIRGYKAAWSLRESTGFLTILIGNNDDRETWSWTSNIPIRDKETYSIMVDLLRNEKPLYWFGASGTIGTGPEEPGEEES